MQYFNKKIKYIFFEYLLLFRNKIIKILFNIGLQKNAYSM